MTDGSGSLLIDDGYCFGCGENNPIGLHLKFGWREGYYETVWTPTHEHQGWAQRVHGGMIGLVLDEILSRAVLTTHGMNWVTAELTTRFIQPARIGITLVGRAKVDRMRSRLALSSADIREQETGDLVAAGSAKMMPAK